MAYQPIKFYQVGSFVAGNRLLDPEQRSVQARSERSNTLTCGHRACQGCGEAAQLAVDQRAVEVEEGQRRQPVRAPQQPGEGLLRDRAAAEPGDHVVDERREPGQGEPDVLPDDPPEADRERLLDDDHPGRGAERGAQLLERERPEALDPDGADLDAAVAQLVDDLLDRAEHRSECDDDRVRVGAPVGVEQAAGAAAERL